MASVVNSAVSSSGDSESVAVTSLQRYGAILRRTVDARGSNAVVDPKDHPTAIGSIFIPPTSAQWGIWAARGYWGETPFDTKQPSKVSVLVTNRKIRSGIGADDDSYKLLGAFGNLKTLSLNYNRIDWKQARSRLAACRSLERLEIAGTNVRDGELSFVLDLPNLRHLNLADTDITDASLTLLAKMPHLTRLSLGGCKIRFQVNPIENSFSKLTVLNLHGTTIRDDTMPNILKIRTLEELSLGNCKIGDVSASLIPADSLIQSVDFGGTDISDKGVRDLARNKRIKRLFVDHTMITDESVSELLKLRRLELVDIRSTMITKAGCLNLWDGLMQSAVVISDYAHDKENISQLLGRIGPCRMDREILSGP